jgi:hypothetical protein
MNYGSGSVDSEIELTGNAFSSSGFDKSPAGGGCGVCSEGAHGAGIVENVYEGNSIPSMLGHGSASDLYNGRSSHIRFGPGSGTDGGEGAEVNSNADVCGCGARQRSAIHFETDAHQGRAHPLGYMHPDYRRAVINLWEGRGYRRSATGA